MDKDKAKVVEIVGTASERAGSFVGKAAALGKRVTGIAAGGVSAGKRMPGLAEEDTKAVTKKKSSSSTKAIVSKSDFAAVHQKLKRSEKANSQLISQIETLQKKNDSLVSELEQALSKIKEITASEGTAKARVAALESELEATSQQLKQAKSKAEVKEPLPTGTKAKLQADLVAARNQLEQIQNEAKKAQSQFESKLKDMQTEKDSLLSDLETAQKEAKELDQITYQANSLAEQVTSLKSKLAAATQKLTESQNQAEKMQFQLESQIKDLQAENKNLISDLQKANSQTDGISSRDKEMSNQIAALESELDATRCKLEEMRSQAETMQAELTSQVDKLQLEKNSLISELQTVRSQVDEAKAQANAMKNKVAELESEVAGLRSELARVHEHESESDNNSIQTEHKEKAAIGLEQIIKEIEPSTQVTAQQKQIGINVENVEESKPESGLESESDVNAGEIEPESIPEVKLPEPAGVTAEDVQAADFKNGAERILFNKALSDFASRDAATRADATAALASIHHELSSRVIIAHMANEPSAFVRQGCIKALTALESTEGLSAIEQALADEAASVRLAAVWGLYRLIGTESIPALTRMLSDKDASVRRRAITCIGWLGRQISQTNNYHSNQVISALIRCLDDPAVNNAALDTLQTVTGKEMSAPRTSPERLTKQWQKWWKAELLG